MTQEFIVTAHCVQPHQRGKTWLLQQPRLGRTLSALQVRDYSSKSSTEEADLGEIETEERVDPYELVKEDILALSDNIKKVPVISRV